MAGAPAVVTVVEGRWDPLVRRAATLAARHGDGAGPRRLLGIAGAPGAGKSTLAAAVVSALDPAAVLVPMDGFHLAAAELHRLGRHERKGAIDTFDADGFVALLRRLRVERSDVVYAPEFRREIEEPIAGAIPVGPSVPLVVTEGNYLLADDRAWSAVRTLLDEVWFLEVDEQVRLDRLTARHTAYGRPPAEAAARARGTDQRNADLIAATSHRADLLVRLVPETSAAYQPG
jgi:pantothenate kinase